MPREALSARTARSENHCRTRASLSQCALRVELQQPGFVSLVIAHNLALDGDTLDMPVEIGGVALPLGERRLILEGAEPLEGLQAFQKLLATSAEPTIDLVMKVSRLIHEFPEFITVPPAEGG